MPERLLFVPAWFNSPQSCDRIPAMRAALDDLSTGFDVTVFHWPTVRGGPQVPPTWQGMVAALEAAIQPAMHVVDSGTAAALIMLALGRSPNAASFTAAGLVATPATLRSLAMDSLAVAAEFVFGMTTSHQYVRLLMQGATEAEWADAAARIDEDVDWPFADQLAKSMLELNLVHEKAGLSLPTLYLDTPLTVAGFAEMRDVFLRFVPGAETGELTLWPAHMQEPEAGKELALKVKAFAETTGRREASAQAREQ